MKTDFEIIVIGAGHAGVEAALAAARSNHKTAMITLDKTKIAFMPCNPSIGGPAKGIVVREIDALGGQMAKTADATALQIKLLNSSRGPAVWALRAQSDKIAYSQMMQTIVSQEPNLTIIEKLVTKILVNQKNVAIGVAFEDGTSLTAQAVILTTGTYMSSLTLQGDQKKQEGPDQQRTSNQLSEQLKQFGFNLIRLKTGTPARIARNSVDFSQTKIELGTDLPLAFSHETTNFLPLSQQLPCYLIYTNAETHQIINDNLALSPIYNGSVTATGPRYCPSIEDKIVRFADRPRHQVFLEPESKQLETIYVQGMSTCLPITVQDQMLRTLPGLKNCQVLKWAYAIEYDAIEPTQLWPTLETKKIKNLYTAGQINGTSGYEEAACQGLMAAINAHLRIINQPPLILKRDEAYIGVLIDDLVTKGVTEPYRLLTSLAEHRLLLRNDNAQTRLLKYGYQVGLISQARWKNYQAQQILMTNLIESLKTTKVANNSQLANKYQFAIPENKITCYELIKRPNVRLIQFTSLIPQIDQLTLNNLQELEITIKFSGYIEQQQKMANQMLKWEEKQIPNNLDYDLVASITNEAREKLKNIKPLTIAHASRISGVSPADIQMLLFFLKKEYAKLSAN